MSILGQGYDTPIDLATKIISIIPAIDVSSVADICCGSGNLLMAAKTRWQTARYVGIDIDSKFRHLLDSRIDFQIGDGRNFAVEQYANRISFDLVLANPPYGKKEEAYFYSAGIPEEYREIRSSRIEVDMLIGNALLVSKDGFLLTIMPETLLYGCAYEKIKSSLSADFSIRTIIKLPIDTFKKSRVSSCAIIWQRSKSISYSPRKYIAFKDKNSQWEFIEDSAYQYFPQNKYEIIHDDIELFRGNISSNDLAESGSPVLHNSVDVDAQGNWTPTIFYTNSSLQEKGRYTEAGDIIINRVGRGAGLWRTYNGMERCLISDCLIVLRVHNSEKKRTIIDILKEHSINGILLHLVKGVAAKYLAQKDLINWIMELISNKECGGVSYEKDTNG